MSVRNIVEVGWNDNIHEIFEREVGIYHKIALFSIGGCQSKCKRSRICCGRFTYAYYTRHTTIGYPWNGFYKAS